MQMNCIILSEGLNQQNIIIVYVTGFDENKCVSFDNERVRDCVFW